MQTSLYLDIMYKFKDYIFYSFFILLMNTYTIPTFIEV